MPEGLYIGKVVWYYAHGTPGGEYPAGVPRAAVITDLWGQAVQNSLGEWFAAEEGPNEVLHVGLCILNPSGLFFNPSVPWGKRPGHWSEIDAC